jgi:hypothetical protein
MHGIPRVAGGAIEEHHIRFDEFELQGVRINCSDTYGIGIGVLAGSIVVGADDRIGEVGELGGKFGIEPTFEGLLPIPGGYALAVGPFGIGTQMKCVGAAIGGNLLAGGGAGHKISARHVSLEQRFPQC